MNVSLHRNKICKIIFTFIFHYNKLKLFTTVEQLIKIVNKLSILNPLSKKPNPITTTVNGIREFVQTKTVLLKSKP